MDTDKIEEIGLEPLQKKLRELGGWPVLEDNWDEEAFSWQETVYKLR